LMVLASVARRFRGWLLPSFLQTVSFYIQHGHSWGLVTRL
jgi:hypothetical protein